MAETVPFLRRYDEDRATRLRPGRPSRGRRSSALPPSEPDPPSRPEAQPRIAAHPAAPPGDLHRNESRPVRSPQRTRIPCTRAHGVASYTHPLEARAGRPIRPRSRPRLARRQLRHVSYRPTRRERKGALARFVASDAVRRTREIAQEKNRIAPRRTSTGPLTKPVRPSLRQTPPVRRAHARACSTYSRNGYVTRQPPPRVYADFFIELVDLERQGRSF